jgi:hypothetical protein
MRNRHRANVARTFNVILWLKITEITRKNMKTLAKHHIHPIHRDLMIALSLGFAGAVGIVSTIVLIFG